ncbi:helix-turn-helix domain-containing protein [Leifsonia sp. ZF2019]
MRLHFARLLDDGLGHRKAARTVGISEKCAWSWMQLYRSGGPRACC